MKKYMMVIISLFIGLVQSNELQNFYQKHLIPSYDARYQLLDKHVNKCRATVSKCLPLSVMVKQPKRTYMKYESLARVYYAEKVRNCICQEGLTNIEVVQKKLFMPISSIQMCVAADFVEGNCNKPLSLVEVQELLCITENIGYCDWSYSNDSPANIIRRKSDGKLVIVDTGDESFGELKTTALEHLAFKCTLMQEAREYVEFLLEQKDTSQEKLVVDREGLDVLKSQLEESRRSS